MTEPQAFKWIQRTAMDHRMTMREVAERIIDEGTGGTAAGGGRVTAPRRLVAVVAVAVALLAAACTGDPTPRPDNPEPVRPQWHEAALPVPPGPAGRLMVRDATTCGDRWYVVGGVITPGRRDAAGAVVHRGRHGRVRLDVGADRHGRRLLRDPQHPLCGRLPGRTDRDHRGARAAERTATRGCARSTGPRRLDRRSRRPTSSCTAARRRSASTGWRAGRGVG